MDAHVYEHFGDGKISSTQGDLLNLFISLTFNFTPF